MRFSALGDVAMLSPVVREYALQHTEDSVTVLSVPFCAPLFEDIAPNVSFLGRDVKTQYRGVTGLYRLFKELHAMHFDRIVDAHDVLRTKVLRQFFRLRGYEVRVIDKHRSERRRLTAEPGKKVLQQLPTSFENYAEAMRRRWGFRFFRFLRIFRILRFLRAGGSLVSPRLRRMRGRFIPPIRWRRLWRC